jgi:hypothetical protein
LKAMRRQLRAMTAQQETMEQQGKTLRESVDLAYQQFITANPPVLAITNVAFQADAATVDDPFGCAVSFVLVNQGNTPARIAECSRTAFEVLLGTDLPPLPLYAPPKDDDILAGRTLQRGEALDVNDTAGTLTMADLIRTVMPNSYSIVLLGWIRYQDQGLNYRKLGFCYALHPGDKRFMQIGGADYNYSY